MRRTTTSISLILSLCLLQGCTTAQTGSSSGMREVAAADTADPPPPATSSAEVPELTLNLPGEDCDCSADQPARDMTFFDRGFSALVNGDHIEAVQYFQRYQRLEKTPLAAWEAGTAIAYISTLQHSPFYDASEARKSYRELQKQYRDVWDADERALLMQMSLESFRVMYRHMDDLQDANGTLKEDLEKREEALKRLRELTLGQKATRQ